MAYGKNPFSKSPLPTGDFKTSQKRLTAEIKEVEGKKSFLSTMKGLMMFMMVQKRLNTLHLKMHKVSVTIIINS